MGQKIHPTGFRLAVSRNWASRWYANNRDFAGMLAEDVKVREYLKAKLKNAAVARVLIERPAKSARITIYSARPGAKAKILKSSRRIWPRSWECRSRLISKKFASLKWMPS